MSAVEELLPWMPVQIRSLLSGEFGEWQDDEIVDEIERMYARPGRPVSVRDHRLIVAAVAELRAEVRESDPDRRITRIHAAGPERIVTTAEVEAVRDRLKDERRSHGYGSIAKEGGWSVSTVRRRLEGN